MPDGNPKPTDDIPDDDELYEDELYDWDDEYEDGHGLGCDCEECLEEEAMDNCGRLPPDLGGGCQLAGSEYCDFDCPFRDREDDEDE